MNVALSLITAAVIEVAGIFIVKKRFKDKEIKSTRKQSAVFLTVTSVVFAAFGIFFPLLAAEEEWTLFSLLRVLSVIYWTYFAAVVDVKLKIIPNELIVGMLIELMAIFVPEALLNLTAFKETIVMALLGGLIMGGIFLLGRAVSKGGMGMGDVKLVTLCGLLLGFDSVIGMTFWALLFSVITGLVLIIAKKAKMKSKLPMGPFFFGGAAVSHIVFIISGLYGG